MSCTVSELPSGCRLRGMSSTVGGSSSLPIAGSHIKRPIASTSASTSTAAANNSTTHDWPPAGHSSSSSGIHGVLTPPALLLGSADQPASRTQSQKPCCFCWCCCCSCSWAKCLALRNGEDGPTKKDPASSDLLADGDHPTLDEIRGWGKSFDKLMKSTGGRKVFRDFLRCEYSEENILFWLACEELKRETSPEAIDEKARLIYEDYVSILSPKEVSLDSRVREIINRNMVEPTPHAFDEAQLQIYTLMHRDSYPRFINSQLFKSLAQIPEGASASGSKAESPT